LRNLLTQYLGEDWMESLDDPDLWNKLDQVPDADLWNVRLHLKRKLAFYMRERVRDAGRRGLSSGAGCFVRRNDQSLRVDHRLCAPLRNV